MASMSSLRTAVSHSLKGSRAASTTARFLSTSSHLSSSSAGSSSQAAQSSTTSSSTSHPVASLSSGSLPQTPITSTPSALELLRTQPHHYVVASITGRTLLMAPSDLVTVPRLRDVQVGDVIELDRIHEVGSRDYTLRAQDPMHCRARGPGALMRRSTLLGQNSSIAASVSVGDAGESPPSTIADEVRKVSSSWATRLHPAGLAHIGATLSPDTVRVRAVVVEHTKGAMERIVKTKRRKGYKKTIEHKQPYTRIRIETIEIAPRS